MSYEDSRPASLDSSRERQRRFHFDPTINAGHVLTMVSMLLVVVTAWASLDKRVVVLEEAKVYQRQRDENQDTVIKDKMSDIKETLRELKESIESLSSKR